MTTEKTYTRYIRYGVQTEYDIKEVFFSKKMENFGVLLEC